MHGRPCGITHENGRDCPAYALPGSPLNLCPTHLRKAAELHASAANLAPQTRIRERCPQCSTMSLVAVVAPPSIECRTCAYTRPVEVRAIPRASTAIEPDGEHVVYYLAFGDRIKIGTTRSLTTRLAGIPHDKVLAVERGDRTLERERHHQFAHLRITKRGEWFYRGPDLLQHIADMPDWLAA